MIDFWRAMASPLELCVAGPGSENGYLTPVYHIAFDNKTLCDTRQRRYKVREHPLAFCPECLLKLCWFPRTPFKTCQERAFKQHDFLQQLGRPAQIVIGEVGVQRAGILYMEHLLMVDWNATTTCTVASPFRSS